MTLVYATGFDLCGAVADANLDGWSLAGGGGGGIFDVQTTNGRNGGACIRWQRGNGGGNGVIGGVRSIGTQPSTAFVGCAFIAPTTTTASGIVQLLDSGTPQVGLLLASDGSIAVSRNVTTIGTMPAGTLSFGTYHYIEVGVVIAGGTAGSVTVKIDQITVLTLTGVNTQATGNTTWNQLLFGGGIAQNGLIDFRVDDVYVCNALGTRNNTFLGDVRVLGNLPSAGGATTQMTKVGASATNWQSVNEKPTNGDTTYVASSVVGTTDTYGYPDLPNNTTQVLAVIGRGVGRKDDAGSRSSTTHMRGNNSEANAPTSTLLTTSYATSLDIMEVNPVTLSAWSPADVNAAEFGPTVAA